MSKIAVYRNDDRLIVISRNNIASDVIWYKVFEGE